MWCGMQLSACCTHRDTVFERLADRFLSYQICFIIMLTAHTIHLQQRGTILKDLLFAFSVKLVF
jgi:hypothetical protein